MLAAVVLPMKLFTLWSNRFQTINKRNVIEKWRNEESYKNEDRWMNGRKNIRKTEFYKI